MRSDLATASAICCCSTSFVLRGWRRNAHATNDEACRVDDTKDGDDVDDDNDEDGDDDNGDNADDDDDDDDDDEADDDDNWGAMTKGFWSATALILLRIPLVRDSISCGASKRVALLKSVFGGDRATVSL